jgi:hypothetical protein
MNKEQVNNYNELLLKIKSVCNEFDFILEDSEYRERPLNGDHVMEINFILKKVVSVNE